MSIEESIGKAQLTLGRDDTLAFAVVFVDGGRIYVYEDGGTEGGVRPEADLLGTSALAFNPGGWRRPADRGPRGDELEVARASIAAVIYRPGR